MRDFYRGLTLPPRGTITALQWRATFVLVLVALAVAAAGQYLYALGIGALALVSLFLDVPDLFGFFVLDPWRRRGYRWEPATLSTVAIFVGKSFVSRYRRSGHTIESVGWRRIPLASKNGFSGFLRTVAFPRVDRRGFGSILFHRFFVRGLGHYLYIEAGTDPDYLASQLGGDLSKPKTFLGTVYFEPYELRMAPVFPRSI